MVKNWCNTYIYNTDLDFWNWNNNSTGFAAEIGAIGAAGTSLLVNGEAKFAEQVETKDINVLES